MTPQRPPEVRLYDDEVCIDLFAGGGGTSTGIEAALGYSPFAALNHDDAALAMHRANHPLTHHYCEDVRDADPKRVARGHKVGFAWFSPDCTHFSKAKGGTPFRDPERARRIRGLAWTAVRWAKAVKPRIIFVENVEELQTWGPIGKDRRPDPARKGIYFRRWVRSLQDAGYIVEWRELRACDFGAPTTRKRLFVIARCDNRPIVWPVSTHGKGKLPYRTAAECIDFSIPVPSIFMTPAQARAWAKAHKAQAPRRPLATATLRRIARGIQRFVLDSADPFIIPVTHQGDDRCHTVHEPLRTITTAHRGEMALVAPTLIQTSYGEREGQAPRVLDLFEPLGTVMSQGIKHSLVTAVLVNNSETRSDRTHTVAEPVRTLTAAGARTMQLVTAFLAKHNGGHEATGQHPQRPVDAITTKDSKALVTSHLVQLRGGLDDHAVTGQDVRQPIKTLTAGGTHFANVSALLVKYYGTGRPKDVRQPIDTLTTKDRLGLVTVTIAGEDYAIVDIGMRMLTPRELFRAQGFPADYRIADVQVGTKLLTKGDQTRLVGNSVPPHLAAALIGANVRVLEVGA